MSFENFTDSIFRAYQSHPKANEIVRRKQGILSDISMFHNLVPETILYVGFNPAILTDKTADIYITLCSDDALKFLKDSGVKCTNIEFDQLPSFKKTFDVIIAMDEFFTFAKTDQEQKDLVHLISNLAKEYIITTCRDYKNQDFKDKEFSVPAIVRNNNSKLIYLEFHDYDLNDKNSWKTEVFEIKNNQLNTTGPFDRRAMFFKQLAKFTSDSGAVGFTVHKNLMYKSLIKKNYEHVISIRFDRNEF